MLKQRVGFGKGIPEAGAAVVAGPEELDGAPEAAADEAPKPRGADVAGVELKLKAVGAAAEEEEGSGVLTARGKAAEVVAGAELAEVEPGKLNESAEAAAAAPDAGAGLNPNEGAAKQVHDSRIQHLVKLINSIIDMQENTVVFLMWTYTVTAHVLGYCRIDTECFCRDGARTPSVQQQCSHVLLPCTCDELSATAKVQAISIDLKQHRKRPLQSPLGKRLRTGNHT